VIATLVEFFLNSEGRQRFPAWVQRLRSLASGFPGFVELRQMTPLDEPERCLFLLTFDSSDHAQQWLVSSEREGLLAQITPFWTKHYQPTQFLAGPDSTGNG
jgi:antibiotic biosynthesis monooxygenase (ABM) superfamily enzyme